MPGKVSPVFPRRSGGRERPAAPQRWDRDRPLPPPGGENPKNSKCAATRLQPSLQQVSRGARILGGNTTVALRKARGEALVIELDRDRHQPLRERRAKSRASRGLRRTPRRRATAAGRRPPARRRARQRARPSAQSAPRSAAPAHVQRRREHSGRIADRAAAARAAVVEREHPHRCHRRARPRSPRGRRRSPRGSFTGRGRPPARACRARRRHRRPPPRPP